MKKWNLIGLFLLFVVGFLSAQNANEIIVPLSNPGAAGTLEIDIHNGKITLIGTNRKDILLRYNQKDNPRHDDHNKHHHKTQVNREEDTEGLKSLKRINGQHIELEITEKDNYVDVENNFHGQGTLVLEIEVPNNFSLDIETHLGGSIVAKNISGEINIETHVSSIGLENVSGPVNVSTYAGEINASFQENKPLQAMSFSTYAGKIDLSIPKMAKANFKIRTIRGEILTDLDLHIEDKKPEMVKEKSDSQYKVYINSWTHAKLNGGGAAIKVKTEVGNILLREKG